MTMRVLVTIVGVALYLAGRSLHLPFLDLGDLRTSDVPILPRATWFAIGLDRFVAGFVVVEVLALVIPWGRRLRASGVGGRAKLNAAGLALGSLLTLMEARVLARLLVEGPVMWGGEITSLPAGVVFATLAAAAFCTLGLGGLLTRWGVGNGIAVLFVSDHIGALVYDLWWALGPAASTTPEQTLMSGLVTVGFALVLLLLMRHPPEAVVASEAAGQLRFRVPVFPQGTLAVYWTHLVLRYAYSPPWGGDPLIDVGPVGYAAVSATCVVLLSLLAAWMVSAAPRAQYDLRGIAEVPEEVYRPAWRRQLLVTTILLALVETGVVLSGVVFSEGGLTLLVYVTGAMALVATGLDLYEEGRLRGRSGRLERVLTLDSVHLAEYLRARLDAESVPCVIRAYHFRRLTYFLGPIFKMALLVPERETDRARRLVDETPFRIV